MVAIVGVCVEMVAEHDLEVGSVRVPCLNDF